MQPARENKQLENNKRTNCISYIPVDIHFMWQMTFNFDIFRVLVRSWGKKKNMDFFGWWKQCLLKKHVREKRFTSGINYVQGYYYYV